MTQVSWLVRVASSILPLALFFLVLHMYISSNDVLPITEVQVLAKRQLPTMKSDQVFYEAMCLEDKKKMKRIEQFLAKEEPDEFGFYQTIYYPLQSPCRSLKILGGNFNGFWYDFHKLICLDDFVDPQDECLVYSFGAGIDVSFEQTLAKFGCKVHVYDHTISEQARKSMARPEDGLEIHGQGIGMRRTDELTTLQDELFRFNHRNTNITLIKIDVEGAEMSVIPDWIRLNLLQNVKNLVMEYHALDENTVKVYTDIMRGLHGQGFKLIGFDPTWLTGISDNQTPFGELFFRKTDLMC